MLRLIRKGILVILVIAAFFAALCLFIRLCDFRGAPKERSVTELESLGLGAMPDGPEKREFLRLLRKHGDQAVSGWPKNPYYVRKSDGAHCPFR
jgi:hypothetical protein